jgi:hypothetical protein
MNNSTIFCAFIAITVSAHLLTAKINGTENAKFTAKQATERCETTPSITDEIGLESFYFTSDNVTETFETNMCAYIVYDDPDADFNRQIVRVDYETYEMICAAKTSNNGKITGSLWLNEDYVLATYTYTHYEL